MDKPWLKPDSWILRNFPDAEPSAIIREGTEGERKVADAEEYRRAVWLWQRRPSEISIIQYLLVLGIGALVHIPLILADDFVIFAIYHVLYVGVVGVCVGRFLWLESKRCRWKQDYLRALVRLQEK